MNENELIQIRKKIESLKTSLAVKENDCQRLLNELQEQIDVKDISEVPPILDRLKDDLGTLETKCLKLKKQLTELIEALI